MTTGESKFRSNYTNDQLWELVREAAKKLRPLRPTALSTRKFDEGRETLGHPDAPSGRWIAKRLGLSWPEVVKVAVDEKRDGKMTDAAANRAPAEKWLNVRHLHFALNFVAKKRGERSFTENDYTATRAELLRADAHSATGGTLAAILPTSGQIIQIVRRHEKAEAEATGSDKKPTKKASGKKASEKKAKAAPRKTQPVLPELQEDAGDVEELSESSKHGYWNKALLLAGLEPYEQSKSQAISVTKAIHLYIEACGLIPASGLELKRFSRIADFSMARPDNGERIAPYLPGVAELRARLGLPMADEIGKRGARPNFDLSKLPDDLPKKRPDRGDWADNEEAVIDALCEYLDDAAARNIRRPTRADYRGRQENARRGQWPSASTLGRTGPKSFDKWMARAQKEWAGRRKEQKAA